MEKKFIDIVEAERALKIAKKPTEAELAQRRKELIERITGIVGSKIKPLKIDKKEAVAGFYIYQDRTIGTIDIQREGYTYLVVLSSSRGGVEVMKKFNTIDEAIAYTKELYETKICGMIENLIDLYFEK